MKRYAIVDLEATDATRPGQRVQIIQVGIAVLQDGVVVETYAADVNPHVKLSRRIRQLTGLTDAELAVAPDFSEIAGEIVRRLTGCVFVAHNVKFDYSLLMETLRACGHSLELPAVDTVELARIFYPGFERYGLEALDERLGLSNAHPHAALSDALATVELLQQIQTKIRTLPRAVVAEMLRHVGSLTFDTGVVIAEEAAYCAEHVQGLTVVGNIATRQQPSQDNAPDGGLLRVPRGCQLADGHATTPSRDESFRQSADSRAVTLLRDKNSRQLADSHAVAPSRDKKFRQLSDSQNIAPLCDKNSRQLADGQAIAPSRDKNSRQLSDSRAVAPSRDKNFRQLSDSSATMPLRDKSFRQLSDGHAIAPSRDGSFRQSADSPATTPSRAQNSRQLADNFTRDLSALGLKPRRDQKKLAQLISDDLQNGVPAFFEARAGIGKTYAYLLPPLAAGRRILLSVPTKVLQAQLMADVVPGLAEHLGVTTAKLVGTANYISLEKLSRELQHASGDSANVAIFKMKCLVWLTESATGELSELSGVMTSHEMLDAVRHDGAATGHQRHADQDFWLAAQRRAATADIVVANHAYLCARLTDDPTFARGRVLVVDEAQQLFAVLEQARQEALPVVDEILAMAATEGKRARKRTLESLIFQLGKKTLDVEKLKLDAKELGMQALTDFLATPERIFWLDGKTLKSSPSDFYNFQQLLPDGVKALFVSANISLSEADPRLPELLGFDIYNFHKLAVKRQKNQLMTVVTDAPPVGNVSVQAYSAYLARQLTTLAAMKRPVIVLFTSQLMLDWTAKELSQTAPELNFLAQDSHQNRPEALKKKFDEGKTKMLLGTGAFWEGVDFERPRRVILAIARLPFATPDDILSKKFAAQFDNPFYDFNLPMATMRLRQAIGRVNRRSQQRSVIVVFDRRLMGKTYARRMRDNLQELIEIRSGRFAVMREQIQDFLK